MKEFNPTYHIFIFLILISLIGCEQPKEISSYNAEDWQKRSAKLNSQDSLISGISHLSVYSSIYSETEHKTHNLTATVSMKNININDTVYLEKADYYNSKGKLVRTYFNQPIYLAPLESVEIVIDENDQEGGTSASFIFSWKIKPETMEPSFEGIMISTSGQQGLSFTTIGKKIN